LNQSRRTPVTPVALVAPVTPVGLATPVALVMLAILLTGQKAGRPCRLVGRG